MNESTAVEVVTWTLYLGWLSALAWVALFIGIEPLPTIQAYFEVPWQGTGAALATGVVFLFVGKRLFDLLKARWSKSDDPPAEEPVSPTTEEPRKKKKKAKKKTRKKHR